MNRIQRLAGWFVPPKLRGGTSDESRTAIQLSWMIITLIASLPILELGDIVSGTYGLSTLYVVIGGIVGGISMGLLRKGYIDLVRLIMLAISVILITATAVQAGGIGAQNLFWLIIVPGLATWLKGAESGKNWLLVTLSVVALFTVIRFAGVTIQPEVTTPGKSYLDQTLLLVVLMVVMLILAWLHDRERLDALTRVRKSLKEIKRSNALLEESEDRFKVFANASHDAVIIHKDGKILAANANAEKILSIKSKDVVGKDSTIFTIPSEKYPDGNRIINVKEGTVEFMLQRASGESFPAEIRAGKAVLNGLDVRLVVIRDLSKQKQLESQIVQAQKMQALGNLAGGIAHDFNNLLTIINGHADISANRASGRVLDGLNAIRDASKRATGLINQLLLFSKREQHEPKVVAMNDVVAGMHRLFSRVIGLKIELNLDLADDLWNVYADQSQMEQVVLNLVVNARDALGGNGQINLATSNFKHGDEELVCLQVEDNGCGMDEETKDRVFEPFFSTKGTSGTGLGLSTVYGIVQQSSGEIIIESEQGKGTKFKIILPRCHKEVAPIETVEEVAKASGTANILLAEDDPDIRDMVSMVLEEAGYGVVVAENGKIALDRLNSSLKVDLLITDIIMPEMDGIELAVNISRMDIGLPVLFYSGYTAKDVPNEQSQGAPVDFLKKPFGPQELLRRVSQLLEKTPHNEVVV